MATKNIMIVGVGGQGTLLTSRILGGLAITGGYDVKLSEVHGMAQRGGSVVTFVKSMCCAATPSTIRLNTLELPIFFASSVAFTVYTL